MKAASLLFAYLLLAVGATSSAAQPRTITGTVVGPFGHPVPAAMVQVVGGVEQTTTNEDGFFRLETRAGEFTLRVTAFGYRVREAVVPAGQNAITLALAIDPFELEGIVVTGQATSVARRNLANAVSTVTPTELADAPPAQSPDEILQGRVVGALVERNSGQPGGGIQVRLRGASTLIGVSEPVYVVDGVVVSNASISSELGLVLSRTDPSEDGPVNRVADLNPAEIERIEILKGASAAALYGSRAANGVIIITTKKGTAGPPRIKVSQRFGLFQRSNSLPFRQWTRQAAIDFFGFSEAEANQFFRADGRPRVNQDHEKLLADWGDLSVETNVSVNGGTQTTLYFASATWRDDDGIIDGTGYGKQNLRLNLQQTLSERLEMTASTNLIHTVTDRTITNNENEGTSLYMVLPLTPNFVDLTQNPDGTFPENPFERSNPLQTVQLADDEEEVYRFIGSLTGELEVFETPRSRLSVTSTFGADYFTQKNDILLPPELHFEDDDGLIGTSVIASADNIDLSWTGNAIFDWTADALQSTTTVGFQYEDRDLDVLRNFAQGLSAGQPNVDQGVVTFIDEDRERVKDFGIFAQEEVLLLDERLFLTAGIRADRSSVNADGQKFFVYPKASGSFRFNDLTAWLEGLKLRVAWGQSGNQPLFGQKFTPLNTSFNIEGIPVAFIEGSVAATDLGPERQAEIEFGADLTLSGGRAHFTGTYFKKTITDLLLQRDPGPSSGFVLETFNGGEMETEGVELTVDAVPFQRENFIWLTRATFYRDESTVTELPVPPFETAGFGVSVGAIRIEEGESPTSIVANAGIDEEGNPVVAKVGDVNPDFRMGFSNNFKIFDFSLHSLLEWSQGQDVLNLTQLLGDFQHNWEDWTIPTSDGASTIGARRLDRLLMNGDLGGYVQDASYLKLRELSVSYELPSRLLSGPILGRFSSLRFTLSGRNLITWTGYEGLDPEVSNFGNQPLARNFDVAPFPPSRSFWFGVDLGF